MPKRKLHFGQKFARMSGWITLNWDSVASIYPQINLSVVFNLIHFWWKTMWYHQDCWGSSQIWLLPTFWSSTRGFLKLSKWTLNFHLGELCIVKIPLVSGVPDCLYIEMFALIWHEWNSRTASSILGKGGWSAALMWKRYHARLGCQLPFKTNKILWGEHLLGIVWKYMAVSENNGTPKSSILIGFSIINHPFWGITIFGNTHILTQPMLDLQTVWSFLHIWYRNNKVHFLGPCSFGWVSIGFLLPVKLYI